MVVRIARSEPFSGANSWSRPKQHDVLNCVNNYVGFTQAYMERHRLDGQRDNDSENDGYKGQIYRVSAFGYHVPPQEPNIPCIKNSVVRCCKRYNKYCIAYDTFLLCTS